MNSAKSWRSGSRDTGWESLGKHGNGPGRQENIHLNPFGLTRLGRFPASVRRRVAQSTKRMINICFDGIPSYITFVFLLLDPVNMIRPTGVFTWTRACLETPLSSQRGSSCGDKWPFPLYLPLSPSFETHNHVLPRRGVTAYLAGDPTPRPSSCRESPWSRDYRRRPRTGAPSHPA